MARPTLILRTLVATMVSLSTLAAQGAKKMPGGDSPTRQIIERFNDATVVDFDIREAHDSRYTATWSYNTMLAFGPGRWLRLTGSASLLFGVTQA